MIIDQLILLAGRCHPEPLILSEKTEIVWNDNRVISLLYSGWGGCNISYESRVSVVSLTLEGVKYYTSLQSNKQQ